MPCEPEQESIRARYRLDGRILKAIVFTGWVILPLLVLLITEIEIVSRIAFWTAVAKLIWETMKIYGKPRKWFPAYERYRKRIDEEELRKRHFIYHCERNPKGFARLKAENFERERTESRD